MVRKRLRFTTRSAKTLQAFGEEGSLLKGNLVPEITMVGTRSCAIRRCASGNLPFAVLFFNVLHTAIKAFGRVQPYNAGRAGAQPWPIGLNRKRESSGSGSRSRSMTTIVAFATAGISVCI